MHSIEARHLFPLTGHWIFMNHAGNSPMSERGRAAVEGVLEGLSGKPYPGDWAHDEADRLREGLARLFSCSADSVAITRSTSHGLSLLAAGLDWQPGDNVVGARGEYPANIYPWMRLGAQGVELRLAGNEGGRVTPESVLGLVDERTRVVSLSHVEFWNGYRVDIEAIGRACREQGVILAVDAMQSAGALDIDLSRLAVDVLAAGASKWLLGGVSGIGFAAFSPSLLERLTPPIVGACSVREREDYFHYDLSYEPSARRFEESAISLLDLAAFGAAVDLLLEIGMKNVEARILALSRRLADGLVAAGYEVVEPWPRSEAESSGIVSFRKPGAPAAEIVRDLRASHIEGRLHADFVRLSPHFYNTEEEVDRVLEVLAADRVGALDPGGA